MQNFVYTDTLYVGAITMGTDMFLRWFTTINKYGILPQ